MESILISSIFLFLFLLRGRNLLIAWLEARYNNFISVKETYYKRFVPIFRSFNKYDFRFWRVRYQPLKMIELESDVYCVIFWLLLHRFLKPIVLLSKTTLLRCKRACFALQNPLFWFLMAIASISDAVCISSWQIRCHILMNMASCLNGTDATFFFLSCNIEFAYIL